MITADELRQVVQSLPEAEERETWGHPTFRVRDKMFATMSDDGRQATVKATKEEQAGLIAAAPETLGSRPTSAAMAGSASSSRPSTRPSSASSWSRHGASPPQRLVTAYDSESGS